MAKRIFQQPTWTPSAQADGVLTGNWMCLVPGSTTQFVNVLEFYLGGQAGASSPTIMIWARSSTLGITPTALSLPNTDGPMAGFTAALAAPVVPYVAAGTAPNRSPATTVARLNLSLNAFGGIVRWVAAPGEEWGMLGTAVNVSESTLSAFTGGTPGLMGTHIIYEPF